MSDDRPGGWSTTTGVVRMAGETTDDGPVPDEGAVGPVGDEAAEAALGAPDSLWPGHDERPAGGAAWA